MTKHSGLPVHGYEAQSDDRVALVNAAKRAEEGILRFLDGLADVPGIDHRWLAIGRSHIEQGFMATNRAVFRPSRIRLPEDDQDKGHSA